MYVVRFEGYVCLHHIAPVLRGRCEGCSFSSLKRRACNTRSGSIWMREIDAPSSLRMNVFCLPPYLHRITAGKSEDNLRKCTYVNRD